MPKKSIKGKSAHVEQIKYDDEHQTLTVQFSNGSVYEYIGVPPFIALGLQTAESKGTYLAANIKGKYKHLRVK